MTENELNERLSRRFGSDEGSEQEQGEQKPHESQNIKKEQKAEKQQKPQNKKKAQNIKKEWNVRSIYLPDTLDEDLTTAFKRLDLDISENSDFDELKKTRHFYPLVVALGLDYLESMDITEITDRLERNDFVE